MAHTREVPPVEAQADFDRLYRREFRPVAALVQSVTGRWDVAEEIAQDAFVVVHGRWDRVSGYAQPGSFLRRVALNRAVSAWRRRQAEARALSRLQALRPGPGAAPSAGGDRPDPTDQLWAQVRQLPRRQAQVVALTYIRDLDAAAVAELLGVSESTVRTHLRRATASLAAVLEHDLTGVGTAG